MNFKSILLIGKNKAGCPGVRPTSPAACLFMSTDEEAYVGCIAGPSCSSNSARNTDPDPGTPRRCRAPPILPWIEDWAEALQLLRSSIPSIARYDNWVEQRAAYHRGEGPEDAAGRRDDDVKTSHDLCDSQACRAPPGRRSR